MMRTFRKGPVGALMDEYERAAADLVKILDVITDRQYTVIRDSATSDEHCRSIQTILSHVVNSGYGYANSIRTAYGMPGREFTYRLLAHAEAKDMLAGMLAYTVDTLSDKFHFTDDDLMAMTVARYGSQRSDMEQLLEHAIVHILRHRRQIDRFLAAEGDPA
jgi:uncharacterized damage-inducible protein DinB